MKRLDIQVPDAVFNPFVKLCGDRGMTRTQAVRALLCAVISGDIDVRVSAQPGDKPVGKFALGRKERGVA